MDGRSKRKIKVVSFITGLEKNRNKNYEKLIASAKLLLHNEFENIDWNSNIWHITKGRLTNLSGKNVKRVSINFYFPNHLSTLPLEPKWANLTKSLFLLRFHRNQQALPNQRNFITAIGFIAYYAKKSNLDLVQITPDIFENACRSISNHYEQSTAYNLHKAVTEFAAYCDANRICFTLFKYRYSGLKRPSNAAGVGYKRLDDPDVLENDSDRIFDSTMYRTLGELYQKIPKGHKYRYYILMLSLWACTGRRFSEITLLPYQKASENKDGKISLEYFPRKSARGTAFNFKRKLYLPTDVWPVVNDILFELNELCKDARNVAINMYANKGPDLSILDEIDDSERLYSKKLKQLGIPTSIMDKNGWLRKRNLVKRDSKTFRKLGGNPRLYVKKKDLIKYFNKDYDDSLNAVLHVDQFGKVYYLKDLFFVRPLGISSGYYASWISTQCTHSMLTTFLRYLPRLIDEYEISSLSQSLNTHKFRHTLNTLLDEGGLTDLLQTEWFGRKNPNDTRAYQHLSREKKALMLREQVKSGEAKGSFPKEVVSLPVKQREAVVNARINAVHDVGTGLCIHSFSQLPCDRHLQCSAKCDDYIWIENDNFRLDEVKRQFALAVLARNTANKKMNSERPQRSKDWLLHNEKKIMTLKAQLEGNGVIDFDPIEYLESIDNDE